MYARLTLFNLGPGKRETAEKIMGQFAPKIKEREGFIKATFVADDTVGEYGGIILFESKKDAETAFKELSPRLQETLSGIQGEPTFNTKLFEVLEPKN
ncbi:MAG: YdhR family protein [Promethearchaeota archaeon]